jgi:hypothetical protein
MRAVLQSKLVIAVGLSCLLGCRVEHRFGPSAGAAVSSGTGGGRATSVAGVDGAGRSAAAGSVAGHLAAGAAAAGHAGSDADSDAGPIASAGNSADADGGMPPTDDAPLRRADVLRSTPGRTACGPTTTFSDGGPPVTKRSDCASYPRPPNNSEGQPFCCVGGDRDACGTGNLAFCESGNPFYCDESADCDPGLHCCLSSARTLFSCQSSCDARQRLCKSDAECDSGKTCIAYSCGGRALGSCGVLTPSLKQVLNGTRDGGCELLP